MHWKKTVAALFAALCFMSVPTLAEVCPSVWAEEVKPHGGSCGENLNWAVNRDGVLTISGNGDMEIWNSNTGMPWYDDWKSITGVVVKDGVTSISDYAFAVNVDPNNSKLKYITIGSDVTSIGNNAFHQLTSLECFTVSESNPAFKDVDGVLFTKDGKTLIKYPRAKINIAYSIPKGTEIIGKDAFGNCKNLKVFSIPEGVTDIETKGFFNCTSLVAFSMPDSLTTIGDYAFSIDHYPNYSPLTSITIGSGVTSIGRDAFSLLTGLTSISVRDGNTTFRSVDGVLFTKNGRTLLHYPISKTDTSYAIPAGTVEIGQDAFNHCMLLKSVTFPGSVTSIGRDAFERCSELTSVTIPKSVKHLEDGAFSWCASLTDVTILNPDCVLYNSSETFSDDYYNGDYHFSGTLHGYAGSTTEAYAKKYGYTFSVLAGKPEKALALGDLNADGDVTASDAAVILIAAAQEGAAGVLPLSDEEHTAADLNFDGEVTASDAAMILIYAALAGAGYDGTIETYLGIV